VPDFPMLHLIGSKGQETISDCGICAIGTICDKSYEDVVAVAMQLVGSAWKHGLYLNQIIQIAKSFGVNLKRRRKYDLDSDTGIIYCDITERFPNSKPVITPHVAVLMDGRIYDSDHRVWSWDAFQKHYEAKFASLLEVV